MSYIISMLCLTVFYVLVIANMKRMKNTRLFNYLFSAAIVIFYLIVVVRVYLSVGFDDWNFRNTLPVANVSPFMFTLVAIIHLIPLRIKKHLYFLISLLTVGMFLAAIAGCIYNAAIDYRFHWHFISDYLAHVLLSLWGVYLVKSRQVEVSRKNLFISAAVIIGVAIIMMSLNIITHHSSAYR